MRLENFGRFFVGHKNIKLFVSHGGLLGIYEAAAFGVPVLGVPLFSDHFLDMKVAVERKFAIELKVEDITEESFAAAVNKILKDLSYK